MLEQPLDFLPDAFDCSSVHPPSETSLHNVVERWSDAMRPNEIVDIDPFMIIDYFSAGNALFYNMHLSGWEVLR